MRKCGVLLPVFSLPSPYGIGCFSKEAYDFVDFLEKAGQNYWQILPMGPTGYGDSPYQSFSTFAGNPYFIDVREFVEKGFITEDDCRELSAENTGWDSYVNYSKLYDVRFKLLRKAFDNSNIRQNEEFNRFSEENAYWLDDYALFSAVKSYFDNKAWAEWDRDIRIREPKAIRTYTEKFAHEMDFIRFQQFFFAKQWKKVKEYANQKGIEIIGDIPIYVAFDSADVWANPELFDLNSDNIPNAVAGCPPDAFSATGQLWGNPLYKWEYHAKTGFDWWLKRIGYCFKLYDVVRIDHFRGFDEFYAIPYGDPTAEFGVWRQGPGYALFEAINQTLGERKIIAEDLGFLTDSVRELVKKTGFPGMKILQFAFGGGSDNDYLPHNLTKNAVIYTGTHDNETTRGWYEKLLKEDMNCARHLQRYTRVTEPANMAMALIELAFSSVCDTCIIPMQDYLNLGNEARINTPSVLGGNWQWRMLPQDINDTLAATLIDLKHFYNR